MVYRAYSRRPDGRLDGRYGFAAADDPAALTHARRWATGGSCDVWQGARHVGTLVDHELARAELMHDLAA